MQLLGRIVWLTGHNAIEEHLQELVSCRTLNLHKIVNGGGVNDTSAASPDQCSVKGCMQVL